MTQQVESKLSSLLGHETELKYIPRQFKVHASECKKMIGETSAQDFLVQLEQYIIARGLEMATSYIMKSVLNYEIVDEKSIFEWYRCVASDEIRVNVKPLMEWLNFRVYGLLDSE